jgi:uncharacterized protein YdeI (BOF family)
MARRSSYCVETLEPRLALSANVVLESEDNGALAVADSFDLPLGETIQLAGVSLNNNDDDIFTAAFTESSQLNLQVEYSGAAARLEVLNSDGDALHTTDPENGANSGQISVEAGKQYYFRLVSAESDPADYQVTLSRERVGDINLDGAVSRDDVVRFLTQFAATPPDSAPRVEADLNADGTVSLLDLAELQGSLDPEPTNEFIETEMNDARPFAEPVDLGSDNKVVLQGTAVTHADHDFFVFEATATGVLRVEVQTPKGGIVEVQIEDETRQRILETDPDHGVNEATVPVTAGKRLFVRVRAAVDESVDYLIDLLLQETAPEPEAEPEPPPQSEE